MRVTALIPARGGSKGVPGKNLMEVAGRSLLGRAIDTCRKAGVHHIIVSTDDKEIRWAARQENVDVRWRPARLGADDVPTWPVVRDVIQSGRHEGVICTVQCTSPLMTASDINGTLEALEGNDMAVCVHPFIGLVLDGDGQPQNFSVPVQRRQDMAPQYVIAGSVWAYDADYVMSHEQYEGNIGVHVASSPVHLEVDTPADLRTAVYLVEPAWEYSQ